MSTPKATSPRFSRATMIAHVERKIDELEQRFGFDSGNGWAQVEHAPIETVVRYGEFSALCDLLEEICNERVR